MTDVRLKTTALPDATLYEARATGGKPPHAFDWTVDGSPPPQDRVLTNAAAGRSSLTLHGAQPGHGPVAVTATDADGSSAQASVARTPPPPSPARPWSRAHALTAAALAAIAGAAVIAVLLRLADGAAGDGPEGLARTVAAQLLVLAAAAAAGGGYLLAVEARTRAHLASELRALKDSARGGTTDYDKAAPDVLLAMTRTRAPALLALSAAAVLGAVVLAYRTAPVPPPAPAPAPTATPTPTPGP